MFKVTKQHDNGKLGLYPPFDYYEVETEYGKAKARMTTNLIYWADDGFWCNWFKIPELKRVYPPGTYGDVNLYIP